MRSDDLAIEFRNVTKSYSRTGGVFEFKRVLDRIKNGQFRGKLIQDTPFLALDGVSYAVRKGERLGIIGPNGAGKSTSLKLVQKVAHPTSGQVIVHGKVGGLIELGAGFHPDLTGRENVYLNGALQGLARKEIDKLLPWILEIAEIGHFIDVPIKRYSSGMKVRLGFATAIVSVPDIVLMDEVLSVGDARFRKKSESLIRQYLNGRTLLFVSHSLAQVREVCDRAIVLSHGKVQFDGVPDEAIRFYEAEVEKGFAQPERIVISSKGKRGLSWEPAIVASELQPRPAIENSAAPPQSIPEFAYPSKVRLQVDFKVNSPECSDAWLLQLDVKRSMVDEISELLGSVTVHLRPEHWKNGGVTLDLGTEIFPPGEYRIEATTIPAEPAQRQNYATVTLAKRIRITGKRQAGHGGAVDIGFHELHGQRNHAGEFAPA